MSWEQTQTLVTITLAFLVSMASAAAEPVRVLLVHGSPVPSGLDATLKAKLADAGFVTRTARYEQLSQPLLAAFHVVVVMQEPAYGQSFVGESEREGFRQKAPLLLKFVENGGGLYVTHDGNINPQPQDCRLINETLLKPLAAKVLPETVVDEATLKNHVARLLEMNYCSTANVAAHPVTAGVRDVWYPTGPHRFGRDTSPIRVGDPWQVVLRGNATAISGGTGSEAGRGEAATYRSAPPLAAVREFGRGRVFLFPTAARCWFHSAYHRELAGFVLEQGDGFRLVTQALRWLAEPRLPEKLAALPSEPPPAPVRKPSAEPVEAEALNVLLNRDTEFKPFLGVVGLDTASGSVHEYCEAARKVGLHFVAFADDMAKLDADGFARLQADCRRETTEGFVALPGVRYANKWGTPWLALNVPRLPTAEEINRNYFGAHDVRTMTNLVVFATTLGHQPGGYPPFGLRFWKAIDAVACVNGQVVDDSLDWYRYCAANFCVVMPVASQRVAQPADLAAQVRWKTAVFAAHGREIPEALSQGFRRAFITEGPVIRQFSILNPDFAPLGGRWQQGALWQLGDRLALKMDVASDRPLREVKLYWGREVFRCFRPMASEFKEVVWVEPAKDASFWLEIQDAEGRRALSAPILALNRLKRFNWCTDHQNLIDWNYEPSEDKRGNLYDGLYGYDFVHCPGGGDALGSNLPGHEWTDVPAGREVGPQGARFKAVQPWPKFIGANGKPVESVRLRPELRFNSQDCYVLDLRWDGESRTPESPQAAQAFEWNARLINPRGKPYEPNFWLIETHTRLLRDVALGKVDGPEQVLLEAFFTPGRLNQWPQFVALGRDGKLNGETRFEQKQVTVAAASLARHGYVALFPNYWYCPALFAADDGNYVARIGNAYGGNLLLGVESPGAVLKAGIELRHRFVYAVVAGQDTSEAAFERIHRAYGFAGGPTYDLRLERGVVLEKTFALTLKADRYAVRGSLESPNLPSCLLVVMEDLCPNWDAGVFDLKTKQLRRFGTLEGRGYFTLDGRAARHFAAGNLIVCDHREVRLHLTRNADGWVVVAHNPTDTALETTVAVPDWLALLPAASRKVALPPGGTVTIALTR